MITIKGIRIAGFDIKRDEAGRPKVSGSYELMSNTDMVLAKQSFGAESYQNMVYQPSPATAQKIQDIMAAITADLNANLGMGTPE